ncbi:hypothetical protein GDO81_024101 [Engystomops pustulosus]|uniref:Uncharacterized protein n=1 Tax=Engystomops pustulosus TaxID=76066 RepID=A0AAV6YPN8_ENGPU|nr:hypothetical protein GDO81_024101 [Engystomops pustulosus]
MKYHIHTNISRCRDRTHEVGRGIRRTSAYRPCTLNSSDCYREKCGGPALHNSINNPGCQIPQPVMGRNMYNVIRAHIPSTLYT